MFDGYNPRIRNYSVRFKRKIKCYSKKTIYVRKFIEVTILKLNNQLRYFNLIIPKKFQ